MVERTQYTDFLVKRLFTIGAWPNLNTLYQDLEVDPAYVYEMSRSAPPIIRRPPFERNPISNFSGRLENLGEGEYPLELPLIELPWGSLLFEQQTVFPHVIDWYSAQFTAGGIPIPPLAYAHPNLNGVMVVTDGTHRAFTLYQSMRSSENFSPLASSHHICVAQTKPSKIPNKLYTITELQIY